MRTHTIKDELEYIDDGGVIVASDDFGHSMTVVKTSSLTASVFADAEFVANETIEQAAKRIDGLINECNARGDSVGVTSVNTDRNVFPSGTHPNVRFLAPKTQPEEHVFQVVRLP